jgi:hypothetical protein
MNARSAPLQQGSTYLVQLSRGRALVRVAAVRSGSPSGRGRGPRPVMDPDQAQAASGPTLVLLLEWRLLPE